MNKTKRLSLMLGILSVVFLSISAVPARSALEVPASPFWGKLLQLGAYPEAVSVKAVYFFPGNPTQGALHFYTVEPQNQQIDFHWSDSEEARLAIVTSMRDVGANTIFEPYKGSSDCGPSFIDYSLDAFMSLWDIQNRLATTTMPSLKIVPSIENIQDVRLGNDCPIRFHFASALDPSDLSVARYHIVELVNLIRSRGGMKHWARLFDRNGIPRYTINLPNAGSNHIAPAGNDKSSDATFVRILDKLADDVYKETGILVGFTLDPIVRRIDPEDKTLQQDMAYKELERQGKEYLVYSLTRRQGENVQVADLSLSKSLLAIAPFISELDGTNAFCLDERNEEVNKIIKGRRGIEIDCNAIPSAFYAAVRYKKNFIKQWVASGVPTFLDLDSGYDSHLVFNPANPPPNGQPSIGVIWGNEAEISGRWLNIQSEIKGHQGDGNPALAGIIYNSWNGYTEGMVAVPSIRPAWNEYGTNKDLSPTEPNQQHLLPVPQPYNKNSNCGPWCKSISDDVQLRWLHDVFSADPSVCNHWYYDKNQRKYLVFGSICEEFSRRYGEIGDLGIPIGNVQRVNPSDPDSVFQDFANGRICWRKSSGVNVAINGRFC